MNDNWEVNLLVGDGDVEGYNKFKLVYVATTQERYKLDQNVGQITGQQPIVLEHVGDVNAPVPARLVEANKLGNWRLSVYDDTNTTPNWDSIFNNTSILTRHFSGATSTAARHTVNGTAQEVRVQIIPEGATNATYFTVQSGYADTSRSYWAPESQQSDGTISQRGAWFVPVFFTFEDAGKGDPFTLRNDLPSSPHMIEDSNSDGLADGLTLVGTPTTTINSVRWLVGGQSQQITTDATTNEGFRWDYTVTAPVNAVAYVWLNTASGDKVTVNLTDGASTSIESKKWDPADPTTNSDKSAVDSAGGTWYRVSVSGANVANDFILFVSRVAADATQISTFRADAGYLQTGTLVAPDGWCSSSSLKNRYDPTSTSAATQQQINYLDVWGIPGDLPAYIKYENVYGSVTDGHSGLVSKRENGKQIPSLIPHFFDSSEFTVAGTSWTTVVDATRIGGSYISTTGTFPLNDTVASVLSNADPYLAQKPLRVFAVIRTSASDGYFKVSLKSGITTLDQTDNILPQALNTWSLVDAGLLNTSGMTPDATTLDQDTLLIGIDAGGTGTIFFDGVYLLPVDEYMQLELESTPVVPTFISNANAFEVFRYLTSLGVIEKENQLGSVWYALPSVENRYIFLSFGDGSSGNIEEHLITNTMDVELTIWPRTSHLLGTQ